MSRQTTLGSFGLKKHFSQKYRDINESTRFCFNYIFVFRKKDSGYSLFSFCFVVVVVVALNNFIRLS